MGPRDVTRGGAILALTLALLTEGPRVSGAPGAPPAKTAAEEFKNIQVLKNIPADQLIPTMQFIGASLGVECEFCHIGRDMDKDDKKAKKTAREMMRMMFAVNQNNFSGEREVTCNTCHRGSIHPQAIPAIATEAPKPPTTDGDHDNDAASLASWPSGNSVMAKYLEALGGKPTLEKVATRVEKGNAVLAGGRGLPIEIFAKAPDERVSVMHTANGDSVTAFNGHVGWLAAPGRPLREMSAADQYAARLDATVMFPANLAAMFDELKLQPHPETVDGHAATVVWGITKGQPPVRLYFDPQSGLLLRVLHYVDTALGLNPTQVDYSEYRDVGGVKTPYRWTIARPSGAFTIQLDEVHNNAPIDAAKFVEPAQPLESGPESNPAH
jgi:photosynthetic reaction center cytochrome c subunit